MASRSSATTHWRSAAHAPSVASAREPAGCLTDPLSQAIPAGWIAVTGRGVACCLGGARSSRCYRLAQRSFAEVARGLARHSSGPGRVTRSAVVA